LLLVLSFELLIRDLGFASAEDKCVAGERGKTVSPPYVLLCSSEIFRRIYVLMLRMVLFAAHEHE
jgi:hypothetical protein